MPEPGAESSAECYSDMPQFALWKLNPTAERSYSKGSETESCHDSRSGTTCEHSTESLGADVLTSCAEDSLAKIFQQREAQTEKESTENEADYGAKWRVLFARLHHPSSSWRTAQLSLFEGWESLCGTWPRWGMMQDGECFLLEILAHDTSVREYGLWPAIGTPLKTQRSRSEDFMSPAKNPFELCPKGWLPCPIWVERLMGWPDGWTDLQPLEMAKFREWLRSHSER